MHKKIHQFLVMKNNIVSIIFYFHFSLGVSLADVVQDPKMLCQRLAGRDLDLACTTSTKGTELHKQREWFIMVVQSKQQSRMSRFPNHGPRLYIFKSLVMTA